MSLFSKVANFLTGGIGGKIADKIINQFPDKLSDAEKAKIKEAIIEATREHELKLLELAKDDEVRFNERIKEMEGTAKDLQQFGFFGKVIVFLRGMQRPLWGYAVLIMDFFVFSGRWNLHQLAEATGNNTISLNLESAFWLINFLVLGFLFGERAMKNVLPLMKGLQVGGNNPPSQ